MKTYDELWSEYKRVTTPQDKCRVMSELKVLMINESERRKMERIYNTNSPTV